MEKINQEEVETIIKNIPKGSIFSIEFFKKDGSLRKMNCRTGVKRYLTPNPSKQKPEMTSNYITVWDIQNKGYRHINTDTTKKIKCMGFSYEVEK